MRQSINGGSSYAEHMAAVAQATGMPMPKPPEFPPQAEMVWLAFTQIDAQRGGNGFMPNSIGYADMLAWQSATGWTLDPWEVDALREVDDAYLEHSAKQSRAQ